MARGRVERIRLCRDCGAEFTARSNSALRCPDCKRKHINQLMARNYAERALKKRIAEENAESMTNMEKIQKIAAEAREAGMHYGPYVAFRGL